MDEQPFLKKKLTVCHKPYQIQNLLGEGSHATVWRARAMLYPHNEIALKIARATQGIAHERVQNEIWFLKEIAHPSIPPMLDHGVVEQHLWFAMPIFEPLQISLASKGRTTQVLLNDIRSEGYPARAAEVPLELRTRTAVGVLSDIGTVIAYLSGTGIIHADISPGNIMEKRGSLVHKQYVLADWGATALLNRYPAEAFGSLHFTAPERLLGQVGSKSDLFSLGVTCFYILTGNVPYHGKTGEEYYMDVASREGLAPSDITSGISSNIDRLVRDLICWRPEDRPEPEDVVRRMEKIRANFA
jgi:serine/threonine-protein kinase